MRIHCLQHLEFETFGTIRAWTEKRGHTLTVTRPYETLPCETHSCKPRSFPDLEDFDLLIIMGGLMSVYEEDAHPWIKAEKEFIKKAIETGKPVLGSCLGAQLIAEVLGARVAKNRYREIGWHRVRKTGKPTGPETDAETGPEEGIGLPECFPEEFTAFMWHGDTFEIPAGAKRLFESEACPNHGYIYNGRVLGLQFHPEADETWIGNLVENCRYELTGGEYVQAETEILGQENNLREARQLAFGVLDWFEKIIAAEKQA